MVVMGLRGRLSASVCVDGEVEKWLRLKFVSVFYDGWCFVSEIKMRN
jgi:hypothetical protein